MRLPLALAILAGPLIFGQPAFDVVSLKPMSFPNGDFARGFLAGAGACSKPPLRITGNRVTIAAATACGLIRVAFDVPDYRISNMPAWMAKPETSDFFQVEARGEGDAVVTDDQAKERLRTLIADRFQFKFHREAKDLPVYHLVAGKNGSKLSTQPLPAEGVCSDSQAAKLDAYRKISGQTVTVCKPTMSMAQLADNLSRNVDRPVIDKTGLTGQYAFLLQFTPEGKDIGADAAPSIFTAVQDQLGLRLEPAKDSLDVIVIDRIERPAAN